MVINYDVPVVSNGGFFEPDYANYMHRVGRTGRFGTDGLSITFVQKILEYDESEFVDKISKNYSIEIK